MAHQRIDPNGEVVDDTQGDIIDLLPLGSRIKTLEIRDIST
jgi:hypothetical protein